VKGNVSTAPGLVDFDAARRQRLGRDENVRPAAVAAHANRQNWWMLNEQQHIPDNVLAAFFNQRALQRQRILIGDHSEATDCKGTHHEW
jgi:hypothetical protein